MPHLIARDGVEERRDALVEEAENIWEVHDDGAAERLDVVLLQYVQHLACDGDGGVGAEGRALIVHDDDEGFLAGGHQVLRAFSTHGGDINIHDKGFKGGLQPPNEMPQLSVTALRILPPGSHVDNRAPILVEPCQYTFHATVSTHVDDELGRLLLLTSSPSRSQPPRRPAQSDRA